MEYEFHFVIGRKGKLREFRLGFDKADFEKSSYYGQMSGRIFPLAGLEHFLDDNQMIFRYNEKIQKFSMIKADYLLEGKGNVIPSYKTRSKTL